jgi:hypothetical protein
MFCPKCNQQQGPEAMRFCSKCGFPLAGLAVLLQNNGMIPEYPAQAGLEPRSSRKSIMLESAIFTVVAWVIGIVLTFWFDYGGTLETVAKIGALLFFSLSLIGVLRFLYGFLFAKGVADQSAHLTSSSSPSDTHLDAHSQLTLPAQQDVPADAYLHRGNTREMEVRPSVTENTTRLLDEQHLDGEEK